MPGEHGSGYVYDVEAYYAIPVVMTKMNLEDKLDNAFKI